MKKTLSSLAALSLFLLIGAGCASNTTQTPAAGQNQDQVSTPPTAQEETKQPEMTLKAEALGGNQVKFSWDLPTGVSEPTVFRLVRGPNPNPVSPGNYYYTVVGSKRGTTWISLPTGKQYFRICTFNTEEDKCDVYSNGVEVDVK